MKVTVPEHQSKTTLSALLLELQLTNELAQLSSAISVYQELIAFCLQYAFLFKNEDSAPIGEVFSQKQERLSTPDPARDGVNWLVYCAANPVGRWDPTGLSTLDDFAYQQRTEASAAARKDQTVQNAADALAATGQSKIAAKDIYYGNQKMTQALSVAVVGNTQYLDDKTSQSLQGKSAAEIEATMDQVTYVFGVSRDDVTKMRAELKAQGIDIDFAPEKDSDAFSVAGYVFVFEQESDWGTRGSDGKLNLSGRFAETNKYLAGHELIHQLQAQAWGGSSSFLAEYNRQYKANMDTYSKLVQSKKITPEMAIIQSYVHVGFEKDAYSFGPENYYAVTHLNGNQFILW